MIIEIKIDRSTLPNDGQKVRWQTQKEINNDNSWREGTFTEGDDNFSVGFEDTTSYWDLVWDVHHWEYIDDVVNDLPIQDVSKSFICDYCNGTGWDSYPNHSTTHAPCPKCQP